MKKINWQYAIGELFLIFFGITLAIAFQNWNEGVKEQQKETASLLELQIALNNDMEDVQANINTHKRCLERAQDVLQVLFSKEQRVPKNFVEQFLGMIDYTFLISDVSAYEYLKSEGLQLVKNDSLRKQISYLYDVAYESIYGIEKNYQPIRESLAVTMKEYFVLEESGKLYLPAKNLKKMQQENAVKFDIKSIQYSHANMIRRYEQKILPALQKLIKSLDKELKK